MKLFGAVLATVVSVPFGYFAVRQLRPEAAIEKFFASEVGRFDTALSERKVDAGLVFRSIADKQFSFTSDDLTKMDLDQWCQGIESYLKQDLIRTVYHREILQIKLVRDGALVVTRTIKTDKVLDKDGSFGMKGKEIDTINKFEETWELKQEANAWHVLSLSRAGIKRVPVSVPPPITTKNLIKEGSK